MKNKPDGWTKRDEFAAKALQGLTAEGEIMGDCAENVAERTAELSYIYADAMLQARKNNV